MSCPVLDLPGDAAIGVCFCASVPSVITPPAASGGLPLTFGTCRVLYLLSQQTNPSIAQLEFVPDSETVIPISAKSQWHISFFYGDTASNRNKDRWSCRLCMLKCEKKNWPKERKALNEEAQRPSSLFSKNWACDCPAQSTHGAWICIASVTDCLQEDGSSKPLAGAPQSFRSIFKSRCQSPISLKRFLGVWGQPSTSV